MATIKRFEDIDAWREARSLASSVYKLTSAGDWAKDFSLRDQIRRAAVSVACNIAEGFGRETNTEFARFVGIARGSASEVKTLLYIALDLEYIDDERFTALFERADRICRMTTGLIHYLRRATKQPTTDNGQPTTI